MIIGVKKKFIFIASTKTASTSLEEALRNHAEIQRNGQPSRKHVKLDFVEKEYDFLFSQPGQAIDGYFKFGVMREPLDWIYSWYRYRRGNKIESPLPKSMTFKQFWDLNDWNKVKVDGTKRLQSSFFKLADGTLGADYIIPYHDLKNGFEKVCNILDIKCELPQRNKSNITSAKETGIPGFMLRDVKRFYEEDLTLFNNLDNYNRQALEAFRERKKKAA